MSILQLQKRKERKKPASLKAKIRCYIKTYKKYSYQFPFWSLNQPGAIHVIVVSFRISIWCNISRRLSKDCITILMEKESINYSLQIRISFDPLEDIKFLCGDNCLFKILWRKTLFRTFCLFSKGIVALKKFEDRK